MPKRIFIIAILFCLGGLLAIWETISSLLQSRLYLNFAFFLLPIGIGLFLGKKSAQWWARFWIILGYVLCAFLVLVSFISPASAHASWFGHSIRGAGAIPYIIVAALMLTSVLFTLHRLLYSERSQNYFR